MTTTRYIELYLQRVSVARGKRRDIFFLTGARAALTFAAFVPNSPGSRGVTRSSLRCTVVKRDFISTYKNVLY